MGVWKYSRRSILHVELLMNIEDQFSLEHLIFKERRCRTCGKEKDLLTDFYLIRKNKRPFPSAYSYECKACTVKRILDARKKDHANWSYPDW
jgi:hypothetical protein